MNDSTVRSLEAELLREDRRERVVRWAWRYALPYGGAAAVAMLLAVGSYLVWSEIRTNELQAATSILFQAVGGQEAQENQNLQGITSPELRVLARLLQAAKPGSDSTVLWELADDEQVRPYYRDFAFLLAVGRSLEKIDPDRVQARLESLQQEDSPWRLAAAELWALLLAERKDDRDQSVAILRQLQSDQHARAGVRERASQLAGYYQYSFPAGLQAETPAQYEESPLQDEPAAELEPAQTPAAEPETAQAPVMEPEATEPPESNPVTFSTDLPRNP